MLSSGIFVVSWKISTKVGQLAVFLKADFRYPWLPINQNHTPPSNQWNGRCLVQHSWCSVRQWHSDFGLCSASPQLWHWHYAPCHTVQPPTSPPSSQTVRSPKYTDRPRSLHWKVNSQGTNHGNIVGLSFLQCLFTVHPWITKNVLPVELKVQSDRDSAFPGMM